MKNKYFDLIQIIRIDYAKIIVGKIVLDDAIDQFFCFLFLLSVSYPSVHWTQFLQSPIIPLELRSLISHKDSVVFMMKCFLWFFAVIFVLTFFLHFHFASFQIGCCCLSNKLNTNIMLIDCYEDCSVAPPHSSNSSQSIDVLSSYVLLYFSLFTQNTRRAQLNYLKFPQLTNHKSEKKYIYFLVRK